MLWWIRKDDYLLLVVKLRIYMIILIYKAPSGGKLPDAFPSYNCH